nr:hypothetical protein HK105_003815 [Polyrhizophydium stewartii]
MASILAQRLDHASLVLATFFLGDGRGPGEAPRSRPTLLLMYFVPRQLRAVLYGGFALRLVVDGVAGTAPGGPLLGSRTGFAAAVALLAAASFVNLVRPTMTLLGADSDSDSDADGDGDDDEAGGRAPASGQPPQSQSPPQSQRRRPARRTPSTDSAATASTAAGTAAGAEDGAAGSRDRGGRKHQRRRGVGVRPAWTTSATDGTGWMGAWWLGAGNGDWFAFVGHNGNAERTILPASVLEQMSVGRSPTPNPGVASMEEL